MVILPSEVGLAADIATTIELNSTAQTITAQTSTTTNTPIKTSSSPTATTTTTTTTKTTTDCNPSAFSCDSVDQFCLYFELCTECAKCSAPVCSCQAGWRTNVTDVTISGALQCSLDVDECEDQPCNNSGVCSNSPGSFTCRCPKEFTGVTCDYYVGCARPDVYECPPDQECKLHPVTGGIYGKCLRKNRLDVTPT